MLKTPIIIIGDFSKDLDDEHSLLLAAGLQAEKMIDLKAVISCLAPASWRARVAKGFLQQMGMRHVPVATGSEVIKNETHSYELEISYASSLEALYPGNGQDLLKETLQKTAQPLTLVVNATLTDTALFLAHNPELSQQKIAHICIMGGIQTYDNEGIKDQNGFVIPNNANNNAFDPKAAEAAYSKIQELEIPLTIVTREAAYACQIPFQFYEEMAAANALIGRGMRDRQCEFYEKLWIAANTPPGSPERGTLPADRDAAWFKRIYLGNENLVLSPQQSISSLIRSFNIYDSINLLAAVPEIAERFLSSEIVGAAKIIGLSPKQNGVRDKDALADFMTSMELKALQAGMKAKHSPTVRAPG